MVTFRIDTEAELWDYNYKEQVAGTEEDFNETFVLTGNNRFKGTENASWWQRAKEIVGDLDQDTFPGQVFAYYKNLSRQQRKLILEKYNEYRYSDSPELILEVAAILYPEKSFGSREIRGYCQGDWQNVYYDKQYENVIDFLEAWYFGQITEIHCIDGTEEVWGTITDDELWKWEREGKIKEELLELFEYAEDTECEIYTSNGFVQVKQWEKVG